MILWRVGPPRDHHHRVARGSGLPGELAPHHRVGSERAVEVDRDRHRPARRQRSGNHIGGGHRRLGLLHHHASQDGINHHLGGSGECRLQQSLGTQHRDAALTELVKDTQHGRSIRRHSLDRDFLGHRRHRAGVSHRTLERGHVQLDESRITPGHRVEILPSANLVDARHAQIPERLVVARTRGGIATQQPANVELREDVGVGDEVTGKRRFKPTQPAKQRVL